MALEKIFIVTLTLSITLLSPGTYADQKVTVFAGANLTNAIG